MIDIPKRPDNDDKYAALTKFEKDIIVNAVLCNLPNQTAFLYAHPEFAVSTGRPDKSGTSKYALNNAGKERCAQFWNYGKVREFRADYERTVNDFLSKGQSCAASNTDEITEEDKSKALRAMIRYVIDNAVDLEQLEDPTFLLKIADKTGFFEQIGKKQVTPLRFLPARCKSECNYCFAIETAKAEGMVFDSCDYCQARKLAEEQGFKFDHKTLLNVPAEVVAQFERYNDVKLTDLLDNGQQTRKDIADEINQISHNKHNEQN